MYKPQEGDRLLKLDSAFKPSIAPNGRVRRRNNNAASRSNKLFYASSCFLFKFNFAHAMILISGVTPPLPRVGYKSGMLRESRSNRKYLHQNIQITKKFDDKRHLDLKSKKYLTFNFLKMSMKNLDPRVSKIKILLT